MAGNRSAWISAVLVFLTAAYFHNTNPGWNVSSQFDLTLAIVEHGTLSIDNYHDQPYTETQDKAYFNGHFYSDKSPVTPFLGVPALAIAKAFVPKYQGNSDYHALRYWTTVGSIGILAGALAFLLSVLLSRLGMKKSAAAIAAALWIAGTPLIGYSILFFNYIPACVFALGGFLLLIPFVQLPQTQTIVRRDLFRLGVAGFLIGLACWTLQTFFILALILSAVIVYRYWRSGWQWIASWALGALLGVTGYAIYSIVIFGKVTSPYRYEFHPDFREPMMEGLMGAGWPRIGVIELITVHPFRGLFFLFPCTAAAFIGILWLLRSGKVRIVAVIALAFFALLLLYNSGYYMWWGGWTYAPRHLIPALPFLAIGMLPYLNEKKWWGRVAGSALLLSLLLSAFLNILVISCNPQPSAGMPQSWLYQPERIEHWYLPFYNTLGLALLGQMDVNWGMKMGIQGVRSLFPLAGLWIGGLILLLAWRGGNDPPGTSVEDKSIADPR